MKSSYNLVQAKLKLREVGSCLSPLEFIERKLEAEAEFLLASPILFSPRHSYSQKTSQMS